MLSFLTGVVFSALLRPCRCLCPLWPRQRRICRLSVCLITTALVFSSFAILLCYLGLVDYYMQMPFHAETFVYPLEFDVRWLADSRNKRPQQTSLPVFAMATLNSSTYTSQLANGDFLKNNRKRLRRGLENLRAKTSDNKIDYRKEVFNKHTSNIDNSNERESDPYDVYTERGNDLKMLVPINPNNFTYVYRNHQRCSNFLRNKTVIRQRAGRRDGNSWKANSQQDGVGEKIDGGNEKAKNSDTLMAAVLIKSALHNFRHRQVIRKTWMRELSAHNMVGVFLLGVGQDYNSSLPNNSYTTLPDRITNTQNDNTSSISTHFIFKNSSYHASISPSFLENKKYKIKEEKEKKKSIYDDNDDDFVFKDIASEWATHGDIVQQDFVDNYYNNTYKMMLGFDWFTQHCPEAKFVLFIDDDYYLNVTGLASLCNEVLSRTEPQGTNNQTDGIVSLKKATVLRTSQTENEITSKLTDNKTADGTSLLESFIYYNNCFVGHRLPKAMPIRNWFSKWYISVEEYPWNAFPPYLTAGAFLVSRPLALRITELVPYVRYIRFDDVFLGIIVWKLRQPVAHHEGFPMYAPYYTTLDSYANLVAVHMDKDPKKVLHAWNTMQRNKKHKNEKTFN